MDYYSSYALFTIGLAFEIPLGTAFLRVALNEAKLHEFNVALCMVFATFGVWFMWLGYNAYKEDFEKGIQKCKYK